MMTTYPRRHDYGRELERAGIPRCAMTFDDLSPKLMWPELNAVLSVTLTGRDRVCASRSVALRP